MFVHLLISICEWARSNPDSSRELFILNQTVIYEKYIFSNG